MKKHELNYVTIPRRIASDWRNGKITTPERNLLYWLRAQGDPYGIAVVSLDALAKDTFNRETTKNYINKLLLSLKSKRYIWYRHRAGCRGSFEVRLDMWLMKNKGIQTLDKYFDKSVVRTSCRSNDSGKSEVCTKAIVFSQRQEEIKNQIRAIAFGKNINSSVRGYDNEKDNEK